MKNKDCKITKLLNSGLTLQLALIPAYGNL